MTPQQVWERYRDLFDSVDEAVFTGDLLYDEDNRRKFRRLLQRWTLELDALDTSGFGLNP